ncbi:MAG: hypothetical protein GX347_02635 [Epulopiscium sp.]|nr:hypothetical protein [Candidatus Epulonipiscium sp.]
MQRIGIVIIILLCVFIGNEYGYKKQESITTHKTIQITDINSIPKEDVELHYSQIIKTLKDLDKEDWFKEDNHLQVRKVEGDFIGDQALDRIWIITGDRQQETLLVLYENKNQEYHYVSNIKIMGELKGIQPISCKATQKDFLVLREYVDQRLGAFEETTLIKAYHWKEKKAVPVLTIVEEYHAYWNELWDGKKSKEESHWLQMDQKSYIQWENDFSPRVHVVSRQAFLTSKDTNQIEIPKEDHFDVKKSREISREYHWDPNWDIFVLEEGIDQKTGEQVAIVEDVSDNPFTLIGYKEETYRIKRKSGDIEIVPKDTIYIGKTKKNVQVSLYKNKASSSRLKNSLIFLGSIKV